jgi:hypothetical protein
MRSIEAESRKGREVESNQRNVARDSCEAAAEFRPKARLSASLGLQYTKIPAAERRQN